MQRDSSRRPPPASPPPAYDYAGKRGVVKAPSSSTPPQAAAASTTTMFAGGKWRDLWAAVLFYLHYLAVLGFAVYSVVYLREHGADFHYRRHDLASVVNVVPLVGVLVSCAVASLLVFLVLRLTKSRPEPAIRASFVVNIATSFALCVAMFLSGAGLAGVFALILAVISAIMYFMYRRHIPLSAVILKTVIEVLDEYPAMLNTTVLAVLAQIVHIVILAVCLVGATQMNKNGTMVSSNGLAGIAVALVFSLYWTSQVIQNVSLTTIAGVYATFYFQVGADSGSGASYPTARALRRALTWSFGSICFGSLIVSVLQTIRALVRNGRERNDLAGAIFDCILHVIEDLVRYFNYYAYIHVAIYGKPYVQSAKNVWALLQRNGVMSIINDNIIGTFCFMASLAIATGCAAATFVILKFGFTTSTGEAIAASYASLMLGSLVCYLVLEIVQSGSTTTMVCLAEDPGALLRTKPDLYNKLAAVYPGVFYNWRYP